MKFSLVLTPPYHTLKWLFFNLASKKAQTLHCAPSSFTEPGLYTGCTFSSLEPLTPFTDEAHPMNCLDLHYNLYFD